MNKCYFKRPGEDAIIKEFDYNEPLRTTLEQPDFTVGHHVLFLEDGIRWYAFFDDNGVFDHEDGLIEYNCNLPSNSNLQNQIFGNLVIMKIEHLIDSPNFNPDDINEYSEEDFEKCHDITESDLKRINKLIFTVSEEQLYSKETVENFWKKYLL